MQYDADGRDQGRFKKNQNQKTDLNADLSLELGTASIVVPTINGDSALHMGKYERLIVRTILPKSAGLEKAKLKALEVPRNCSIIEKLT